MESILERIHHIPPYSMDASQKADVYCKAMGRLVQHHYENCPAYRRILDAYQIGSSSDCSISEQPMIPVRLFKELDLVSVPQDEIVKTMTSSGTSGQAVSRICLDKENIKAQTRTLTHIIGSFIGEKRLPLLILDTELVKKDRSMFSARGAGIVGFMTFGLDTTYALDAEMNLDFDKVAAFIEKHKDGKILMFGYTYMIWQYVLCAAAKAGLHFAVDDGILFHIGGWKKLADQAVDALAYNQHVQDVFGSVRVHNYYGMAEQLGSVFVECEYGHMHCSNYSDVLVRRPKDFSVAETGEKGLLELFSLLPTSYPGHILLTEDEGTILGEDDCPCGRKGKYFKIHGRMKGAEIRGCSDTYEKR